MFKSAKCQSQRKPSKWIKFTNWHLHMKKMGPWIDTQHKPFEVSKSFPVSLRTWKCEHKSVYMHVVIILPFCSITNCLCCFFQLWMTKKEKKKWQTLRALEASFLSEAADKELGRASHGGTARDLNMWRNLPWAMPQTHKTWAILVWEAC